MMDSLRSASRNTMFDSWLESAMAGGMARAPSSAHIPQVRMCIHHDLRHKQLHTLYSLATAWSTAVLLRASCCVAAHGYITLEHTSPARACRLTLL